MKQYYKTVHINTSVTTDKSSILVIYTGGTIGMDYDEKEKGLVPFDFEKIVDKVPELKRFDFSLTVISIPTLIDSSNINPDNWVDLARIVGGFYDDYDGFVILHGTDTMAFTASALSFLLEDLSKPIILTGAQLPIGEHRTDARENLISAFEIASTLKEDKTALIKEVCIFFDHVLLRGNRSKKVQSSNFTAFESENYPPLATAGIHINYNTPYLQSEAIRRFKVFSKLSQDVGILKLFPGITKQYMTAILSVPNLKGVVLETYGSGNAPTEKWFLESLEQAIDKGIVVLNVSQCAGGRVEQHLYATGLGLANIGVISGGDMTTEAAVTKLMFLLANYPSLGMVKNLLIKNMRGEKS